VPVVDVGDHDGQRQLLAAVRRSLRFGDPEEREHSTATTAEPSTCELQLLAQGWTPVATGSIRDEPVLVAVNGEGSLLAVDAGSRSTAAPSGATAPGGATNGSEPDWTAQVTDLIVDSVDKVRARTTGPVLDISHASVHAVVALLLLVPVAALALVGLVRLL